MSYQQLKGQSTTTTATTTTATQTSDKCNNCVASSSCCPKTSENFTKLQQKQIANEGESTRSFDHSLSRSFIHSFIRSSTHSVTHLGGPFMLSFIQLSLSLLIAYKSCRLSVARPSPQVDICSLIKPFCCWPTVHSKQAAIDLSFQHLNLTWA